MKNESSHVKICTCHTVTFRDYVVYGLIMLGLIVSPTAIFNSTPLFCTLCTKEGQCGPHPPAPDDPGYHAWWVNLLKVLHFLPAMMEAVSNVPLFRYVRTFCTHTAIGKFTVYFPYVLLVSALILFSIEKLTDKTFKYKRQMEAFYSLLPSKSEKEHTVRITCILKCESAALFAEGWRGRGAACGGGVAELQVQLLRVLRLPHEEPA